MARTEPAVVVTCDDDRGCTNQVEIAVGDSSTGTFFDENIVDQELERLGWSTTRERKDLCEDCARKKAAYDDLTREMVKDLKS